MADPRRYLATELALDESVLNDRLNDVLSKLSGPAQPMRHERWRPQPRALAAQLAAEGVAIRWGPFVPPIDAAAGMVVAIGVIAAAAAFVPAVWGEAHNTSIPIGDGRLGT